MPSKPKSAGFTLVELLIVVAIVAIVAGITFASFNKMRTQQALLGASEQVTTLLNQARAKTLAAEDASRWGVKLASTTVTLFKGSTYSSSAATNVVVSLTGVTIFASSLGGGATQIVFDRLTGKTANYGTITISAIADPTLTKVITIRSTGVASVN
jgi:prepilin-type N-terminal cleavage/methylation domain-containing protein